MKKKINNISINKNKYKIKGKFNFKNLKDNFFSSRYLIVLLGILLVLKTILFYKNTVFFGDRLWGYTVRQSVFFIFIALFPALLMKRPQSRFIYVFFVDIFISFLLLADELYYEYASNIISVMQTGNLQFKDEIIAAIPSLLSKKQFLYFLDIILFIILLLFRKLKFNKIKDRKKMPIIIAIVIIIISCTYYHLIPEALELVTGFIYNKKNSVRYGTIYGYHVVDVMSAISNKKDVIYDSYDEMIKDYKKLKEYQEHFSLNQELNGIAKGKNVIILQLESVQNFVIGKKINGKEITPNLNKFLEENIYVNNMHSSSYTTTADSEHSFMNSMYPLENGEVFSKYFSNTYDDLYTSVKKLGYTNIYSHGNYSKFWNRENVYSKVPIDKTYFIDDFENQSELIRTYLSDELLYKQMVNNMVAFQNPYLVTIIAASSHKPFDLDGIIDKEKKVDIELGEYDGTDLGKYLEAMNYMDYTFGIFINSLKEKKLYDDTVIIVFGDHYGMQMYDDNLKKFLNEDLKNYNDVRMQFEFSNIVCGIRVPGISNLKISTPTNKNDIKPTILQLLGAEDKFSLGMSIFSGRDYTCINNGKIITDKYFYDTEWKNISDGKKINIENLDEEERLKIEKYEEVLDLELGISKSIIVNNLLKDRIN